MNLTPEQLDELEERTAIMEYEGGVAKEDVDAFALAYLLDRYPEITNEGQLELFA